MPARPVAPACTAHRHRFRRTSPCVRLACKRSASDAKPKRRWARLRRESLGSRHGQDPPVRRSCWSRDGSTLRPFHLWEYRNRHRSLASAWRRLAPCRSRSGSLGHQNYSPTAFQTRCRTLDDLAVRDLTDKLRREGVDRHWLKIIAPVRWVFVQNYLDAIPPGYTMSTIPGRHIEPSGGGRGAILLSTDHDQRIAFTCRSLVSQRYRDIQCVAIALH